MSLSNAAPGAAEDVVYQLNPVTPLLNPSEVDSGQAALEIAILWGEYSILHVAHVSPPRAFCVGDAVDMQGKQATDFLIGSESLGVASLPIVVEQGSRMAVVIPEGAEGDVTIDDQTISIAELEINQQLSAAGAAAPNARLYTLPLGAAARVCHRGFTFCVKQTSAARPVGVGAAERGAAKQHAWTFASMALHAGLLLSFQLLPPHSSSLSLDLLNADSRIVSFQNDAQSVQEELPSWLAGERHQGDEGQMGDPKQEKTRNTAALRERRNQEPQLSPPAEAKQTAATAGIIGILRQMSHTTSSPTSIFGRQSAVGSDAVDIMGSLLGDQVGANFGWNGLGAHGHGRGGGGDGKGTIGSGELGTIGRGRGTGTGNGYGEGAGSLVTHTAKVPRVRSAAADVHGSLAKEVIRRIIGRHVSEIRFCYEQALNTRPDLQGRVSVKFVIAPTGAVQAAAVENSDLGNAKTEQCIAASVRRWIFPAPEGGGLVVVNYPFVLSQSGD